MKGVHMREMNKYETCKHLHRFHALVFYNIATGPGPGIAMYP